MFNIGPAELLVVLVIALLVLGPNKLPGAARQVGRALGEMRKLSSGFQAEMRDALKEPVEGKPTTSSKAVSSSTADSTADSSTADSNGTATGGSLSAPRPPVEPALTSGAAVGDESGLVVSDAAVSDAAVSDGAAADAGATHAGEVDTHAGEVDAAGDTHAGEGDAAGDTHAGDTPEPGPSSVSSS